MSWTSIAKEMQKIRRRQKKRKTAGRMSMELIEELYNQELARLNAGERPYRSPSR